MSRKIIIALVLVIIGTWMLISQRWVKPANTISELVATVIPTDVQTNITVLGYYTAGDGGGGQFFWSSTSTAATNMGTVFKSAFTSNGRYLRNVSGPLDPRWFGAIPDGTTDYTARIQDMERQAEATTRHIEFPASAIGWVVGSISITNGIGITWTGHRSLIRHKFDTNYVWLGPNFTTVAAAATNQYCFRFQDGANGSSFTGFDFTNHTSFPNGDAQNSGANVFLALGTADFVDVLDCTFNSPYHQAIGWAGDFAEILRNRFYNCGINCGIANLNGGYGGTVLQINGTLKSPRNALIEGNYFSMTNSYKKPMLLSSAIGFRARKNIFDVTTTVIDNSCVVLYGGDIGVTTGTYDDFTPEFYGVFEDNEIRGNSYVGLEIRNYFSEPTASQNGNTNRNVDLTAPIRIANNRITSGRYNGIAHMAGKKAVITGNWVATPGNPLAVFGDGSGSKAVQNHFELVGNGTGIQGAIIWFGQDVSGNTTLPSDYLLEGNDIIGGTNTEWGLRAEGGFRNNANNLTLRKNNWWFSGLNTADFGTPKLFTMQNAQGIVTLDQETFHLTNGMQGRLLGDINGLNSSNLTVRLLGNQFVGSVLATNIVANQLLGSMTRLASGPILAGLNGNWGNAFTLNADVTVTNLGRLNLTNNSQLHPIVIINAGGGILASNNVQMIATNSGVMVWAPLPSPVTLPAMASGTNIIYWNLSREFTGGDTFYDDNFSIFPGTYIKTMLPGTLISPATLPNIGSGDFRSFGYPGFQFYGNETNTYQAPFELGCLQIGYADKLEADGNTLGGLIINNVKSSTITRNDLWRGVNAALITGTGNGKMILSGNHLTNTYAALSSNLVSFATTTNLVAMGNTFSYTPAIAPMIASGPSVSHFSWGLNEILNGTSYLRPSVSGGMYLEQGPMRGVGAPAFSAQNGDTYTDLSGGVGSTLYSYESGAWRAK